MSHPVDQEKRAPYAPFLELSRFWKSVIVAGSVIGIVAFGFVSASIRLGGGGSGWPLHDALHPLLGIFLGPMYGPISAVLGTAISEVVTPYTALEGLSPLLGGVAALSTGLLVREGRGWKVLWGGILAIQIAYFAIGHVQGVPYLVCARNSSPVLLSLVLVAIPPIRSWWRRHLTPYAGSWRTAAALYVVSFIGSAFGILPFWAAATWIDPLGVDVWKAVTPIIFMERTLFPVLTMLLGMALWPALRRKPFSIANQLRYGLPFCILLTFFFAGRLFVERAYNDARAETAQQIHQESQAAARALNAALKRAVTLLRNWSPRDPSEDSRAPFRWIERVPAGNALPASRSPTIRTLADSARTTGRVQRAFIALRDTAAHSVALAVPRRTTTGPPEVVVACVAPHILESVLSIWTHTPGRIYVVTRDGVPIVERRPPASGGTPSPLVKALRRSPDPTAEAPRGRYENNVLGARAPLPDLPGSIVVERAREKAYFHVFEMLMSMALIILVASGGALVVGIVLSRRVVDPLDRLIEAARRVGSGDLSPRVTVDQNDELGELATTFNTMTQDLSASITRLQANEERLRMALDAARMGTWNWVADPDTLTWSPQTYAILGIPEARAPSLPAAYLARVHPDDREQVVHKVDAILREKTDFEFEHRIRPERSEERWIKVKGRVFRNDQGQPERMSGVVMDVTARKEAERELVAAKEEAEEMSRLKSAFLANVSHEIRTPLTSIIGFAEILTEETSAEQEAVAVKIVRSGRRLKTTLDSVLDLSMIEAGEFSLECRDFDLAQEVRRRADLLRPMAEREGLNFRVDLPTDGPRVRLDPNCLDRILTNLITNAIKFTEQGGVTVRAWTDASHVYLEICDSGIGIDPDFLPELFEAFKQESKGLQREHGGTGLGLSITKELVNLMQGTIEVDTQKGEGTTFTVRLPHRIEEEGDAGRDSLSP